MFRFQSSKSVFAFTLTLLMVAAPTRAGEDDILVGRTAANQLAIGGFDPNDETIGLPCVSGILQGWALDDPGFDHIVQADVVADLYPMDAGAQIRIVCLSIDSALRVISPSFSIMDAPGESLLLGGSSLHTHLTWHINSADPAFNPNQTDWSATFKLIDTGSTGYAESAPFTFHFRNGACIAGDANDDGLLDGRDVQSFAAIVMDPGSAIPQQQCLADCNRDCSVTAADIEPFVAILLGN